MSEDPKKIIKMNLELIENYRKSSRLSLGDFQSIFKCNKEYKHLMDEKQKEIFNNYLQPYEYKKRR
jgi:hypothetical protein